MPFRPPPGRAAPDPRLDPYRERAGALFDQGEQIGVVYLRIDTFWRQTGGHLWWRRWSEPSEQVQGYIEFNGGGFDDFYQDAGTMVAEIGDWGHGRFPYRGEALQVRWLDDEESRQVRVSTFGLDDLQA
ncbi:hypothetical protein [Actinoplanes siamensis]|uniref:Uncharacterized protein n=1 Tax=Actinoplanes siamensis TaxID=1223317 RepID=A0A919TJV6_9ACTN|nr:hypothetical protein [Actinoplanes siamensis]GIF04734.1 hypothetical protein Asi03nite_22720 [Actinoplanes siamensis]